MGAPFLLCCWILPDSFLRHGNPFFANITVHPVNGYPKTNWLVSTLPYDYRSIMHYRICWASRCEPECKDGVGSSPCAVIEPVDKAYDGVIGQWSKNGISAPDAEKARLVYGTR